MGLAVLRAGTGVWWLWTESVPGQDPEPAVLC